MSAMTSAVGLSGDVGSFDAVGETASTANALAGAGAT